MERRILTVVLLLAAISSSFQVAAQEKSKTQFALSTNIFDCANLAQYNMTRSIGQLTHSGGGVYLNADSGNTSGNIASKGLSTFYKMQSYPSLPWGQYSLRAEAEFDGVTKSTVKTLHVTGLPYKADPPSNSGQNPWSGSAYNWTSDFVRLHVYL